MKVYLDASVLVAFWIDRDALNLRADAFFRAMEDAPLAVSDFAAAEFASAVGRKVRTGGITAGEAREGLAAFDAWTARVAQNVELERGDIAVASSFLRRFDLNLRPPDALHIAMTQRLDAELATFDAGMAACARTLGARLART